MLIFNSRLLLDDPYAFVVLMAAVATSLVVGITFHEFAHAFAANRQGDLTATRLGRLTLNPRAHLDPTGAVVFLAAGFGWGKPVPVNPVRLRNGRLGMAIVSAAGPASNVVLALALASLFQAGLLTPVQVITVTALHPADLAAAVSLVATLAVQLNLVLAVFNLLPIPPLDGGGILAGIAPRPWLGAVAKLQQIGPAVLIAIVGTSMLTGGRVLGTIFGPVVNAARFLIS
jgi:Zn-dependent protease